MADEDPIAETRRKTVGRMVTALTIATRLAEVAMHRRATDAREAAARSREAGQAAERRLQFEAAATRQQLRDVHREQWWADASVEQVAVAFATAASYSRFDRELFGVAAYMDRQIQERYGVNAGGLVAGVERVQAQRREAVAAAERAELVELERVQRHAEDPSDSRYWSAWQREQVEAGNWEEFEGVVLPPKEEERLVAERAAAERAAREAAEPSRAAAANPQVEQDERRLAEQYGADWFTREDMAGRSVPVQLGYEHYGDLSAEAVEAARQHAQRTRGEQVEAALLVGEADAVDAAAAVSAEWEKFIAAVRPGGQEPELVGEPPVQRLEPILDLTPADVGPAERSVAVDVPVTVGPGGTVESTSQLWARSSPEWDTPQRATALVDRLADSGIDPDAAAARMAVHDSFATPASAAAAAHLSGKPVKDGGKPARAPERDIGR